MRCLDISGWKKMANLSSGSLSGSLIKDQERSLKLDAIAHLCIGNVVATGTGVADWGGLEGESSIRFC